MCERVYVRMQSSLVGNKLYIFGGEDASRRALGDLHVLDLASMQWERTVGVATGRPAKPQVGVRARFGAHTCYK